MLRLDAPPARRREGQGAPVPRLGGARDGDDRLKPAPFDYYAPETVDEAVGLLTEHGDDAKPIAGGQSLGPLLAMRLAAPAVLVDLNRVAGLDGIDEEASALRIGALTRQRVAERSPLVAARCPLLAEALPWVGHATIRNRGTIGGSLAHADPAAELPAVCSALGAEIEVVGSGGSRTVPVSELFVMPLVTVLTPEELVVAVRIPTAREHMGYAWLELARRHGDFALAGVAAVVELDVEGGVAAARLALAGVAPTPVVLDVDPRALADAGSAAAAACRPVSDLHASASYRRRLAGVLARRALDLALDRARAA